MDEKLHQQRGQQPGGGFGRAGEHSHADQAGILEMHRRFCAAALFDVRQRAGVIRVQMGHQDQANILDAAAHFLQLGLKECSAARITAVDQHQSLRVSPTERG